jgi:hypothetical protein
MKTEYKKIISDGVLCGIIKFVDGVEICVIWVHMSCQFYDNFKMPEEYYANYPAATEAEFEELKEKLIEKLLAL